MDFFTTGKQYYPEYQLLLWHNPDETFPPERKRVGRFRLVLVDNGVGLLQLGHRRQAFIAPALFCLNEVDEPALEKEKAFHAQALYFHPNVINDAFTFKNVRREGGDFSITEGQDLYYLQPFIKRDATYGGQLLISPDIVPRLFDLFTAVCQELDWQRDDFWPCRSRSFFLELLFFVVRVFSSPQSAAPPVMDGQGQPNAAGDVNEVILYLHTHYQQKITIAKLAEKFYTNRTTLTEQFRQITGVPIITYLNRLRIRLAALMLRDTELSIAEIRERVGFKDSTHFGRTFRKYTACSPTEYRQRYCWMLH